MHPRLFKIEALSVWLWDARETGVAVRADRIGREGSIQSMEGPGSSSVETPRGKL